MITETIIKKPEIAEMLKSDGAESKKALRRVILDTMMENSRESTSTLTSVMEDESDSKPMSGIILESLINSPQMKGEVESVDQKVLQNVVEVMTEVLGGIPEMFATMKAILTITK